MGMGVSGGERSDRDRRAFTKRLLREVRALGEMIESGMVESGVRRIGAEQELFLVDAALNPVPKATEVLSEIEDERYEHELGLYNLEFRTDPFVFGGDCLSRMEAQIEELLAIGRAAATAHQTRLVMTGILPTLEKSDLGLHNQTPNPRYKLLNDTMNALRGDSYEINIRGADEIAVRHDSVMLESANTSFQIHFQVSPDEFSRLYNIAQAVCAPVLAAATNSPLLFGKRLWKETRIALFQQSVDTRAPGHHLRDVKPRVSFGTRWLGDDGALEIFREDITRFRVLFGDELDGHDPLEMVRGGEVPSLAALCLHNSTIYRWNRPCYGVSPQGVAHLRIENRVLPSGPTPADEMANAAFWFGLMSGVIEEFGDITKHMDFDDARGNFVSAAREGLKAPITWIDGASGTAHELILQRLLPLAREGLAESGVRTEDATRYLDIIEERVEAKLTGADWLVRSFNSLKRTRRTPAETLSALTAATIRNQETGQPVHTWPLVDPHQGTPWRDNHQRVSQYMSRDLITLHADDPIELAVHLMTWHHVHWIPVEDRDHRLVGLITHDLVLGLIADGDRAGAIEDVIVSEVMATDVPSIGPKTRTVDALALMDERKASCLPVVEEGKLVGLVTEHDVMEIARQLLEERLADRPLANTDTAIDEKERKS